MRLDRVTLALCSFAWLLGTASTVALGTENLFAVTDRGTVHASVDEGATWVLRATLPMSDAVDLIAGDRPDELIVVGRTGRVYLSEDGGAAWTPADPVPASDLTALAGRVDGAWIALAGSGTVWIGGSSPWEAVSNTGSSNCVDLVATESGVYVLTRTGGVLESLDGGQTWNVVGSFNAPDAVSIDRLQADLVALTTTGMTWSSSDLGRTWAAVGTASQVGVAGTATVNSGLAVATEEGMVARSADGTQWTWVGAIQQLRVVALANDVPQTTDVDTRDPRSFVQLDPPAPNPFAASESIEIRYALRRDSRVHLELFDGSGRRVGRQELGERTIGRHTFRWTPGDGEPLPSGVYFLRLQSAEGEATRRVVALR